MYLVSEIPYRNHEDTQDYTETVESALLHQGNRAMSFS